jgi:hypothetical protein
MLHHFHGERILCNQDRSPLLESFVPPSQLQREKEKRMITRPNVIIRLSTTLSDSMEEMMMVSHTANTQTDINNLKFHYSS